jgi:hypothetical protein
MAVFRRLLLVLVALASAAGLASSRAPASTSNALTAPTGLHGFLLRADEPNTTAFHRTPSFAWAPTPGAIAYQFQLSTSNTFRDNGLIFDTAGLKTPVAAPSLILPWTTGSADSLYARVRATVMTATGTDVTPWSTGYGFELTPPAPPGQLASEPGLLRWAPIEGADSYQVWLIDARTSESPTGKKETVRTNVMDEREFYTFHQGLQWIGSIRWRVRAIRNAATGHPANGLPTVTYGAWSPLYSSANPAVTDGPIELIHTVSDVTSDGTAGSPAHKLMPAFSWKGNLSLNGTAAELYRVYVFTDIQCLNLVYTSAVVGSPAYAPRPGGPLALPSDTAGISTARGSYLSDGSEPNGQMVDGTPVVPQEQLAVVTATTTPGNAGQSGSAAPAASGSGSSASASSGSGGSAGSSSSGPAGAGAPVDLWDTESPNSGYYWTVVPVAATVIGAGASTVSAPGASKGSTLVPVTDTTQFRVGQSITVGSGMSTDTSTITAIGNGLLTIGVALNNGHGAGEPVTTTSSGSVVYRDLELPQDVCAAPTKRVMSFGIASAPALTTAQNPFATGLSATGRLTSAVSTRAFYGEPLVAWTPALGAQNYQVQWSKKTTGAKSYYPFKAEGSIMTTSTSAVLPLTPGTWYYRVRGFDYNLPAGAQQMSWSDVQQLVVAAPKFSVAPQAKKKFKVVGKSK